MQIIYLNNWKLESINWFPLWRVPFLPLFDTFLLLPQFNKPLFFKSNVFSLQFPIATIATVFQDIVSSYRILISEDFRLSLQWSHSLINSYWHCHFVVYCLLSQWHSIGRLRLLHSLLITTCDRRFCAILHSTANSWITFKSGQISYSIV